jgi:uncharacterized protein
MSQLPGSGIPTGHAVSAEERQGALLAHLVPLIAMVVSAGFLGFVASLVVYFVYKDKGAFVRKHAANSLNIQINLLLWALVAIPLILLLGLGLLILVLAPIVAFVFHVLGLLKANAGALWEPPFTLRLIS